MQGWALFVLQDYWDIPLSLCDPFTLIKVQMHFCCRPTQRNQHALCQFQAETTVKLCWQQLQYNLPSPSRLSQQSKQTLGHRQGKSPLVLRRQESKRRGTVCFIGRRVRWICIMSSTLRNFAPRWWLKNDWLHTSSDQSFLQNPIYRMLHSHIIHMTWKKKSKKKIHKGRQIRLAVWTKEMKPYKTRLSW